MCPQNENLYIMFQATPVPVFAVDAAFSVAWANSCALMQYPELANENGLYQLLSTEQVESFRADGGAFSVPLGAMPHFAATFTPVKDGYLVMIGYSASNATLLPQSTGFVTGVISAQFRTPVSNLFGIVSSIAREADNLGSERIERLAKSANDECYHLMRFAVDFSTYMKNICGVHGEKKSVINLSLMLNALCEAVKMIVPVRFCASVGEDDVFVKADEQSLSLALLHIISNSCRYTDEKNEITLSLSENGESCFIAIKDKGRGIPPELISKVFEPFFSYDPDGMPFSGSGLGLAIARDMISHCGGSIAVSSAEGEGTTVAVSLPVCHETELEFKQTASARDMMMDHKSLPYIILSDSCECPDP